MSHAAALPSISVTELARSDGSASQEGLLAAFKAAVSEGFVRKNEPLLKRTTLRVGGVADFYAEPSNETELAQLLQVCAARSIPFFVLGRGSNLLIKDGGIRGLVISLAHQNFSRIEVNGERLRCGAGAKLKQVAAEAKRGELTGLEFFEGIPGTVGGALRMNAGAMGSSTFDVVESVRYMDPTGRAHDEAASAIRVEYRSCPILKKNIALGAVFKGQSATRETIEQRMRSFSRKRWDTQPAAPSAGCIFKNPETIPAGKLIDELGLKGARVGDAVVSQEHGNFIINEGHASARDVLELIELIRQRARAVRGIELKTEVEIIGE